MTDTTGIQDAVPAWQPPEWVQGELGGATGRGVRVAVVDSGWDRTLHDERVLPGIGFVHPEDDFGKAVNDDDHDVLGHGTACAEVILSVAPDARIIPVKVFGRVLETSPPTIYAAVQWCIEAGVQIINVSLGTRREDMLKPLYTACEIARRAGIIVVAAGPNAGEASYPAIFEPVIGVSAGRFDSPYHFRYRADDAMECEAWGVERPVLWTGGQRLVKGGTSFAAPNVSGIIALILERHPGATIEQVREMLARFALPAARKRATRRRAASPAAATAPPSSGATRPARAAKAPEPAKEAASPKSTAAARPRKRTAAPATKADKATPAKPPRRTAARTDSAPKAAETKPRKRAAAPASKSNGAATARSPAKPPRRTTGRTESASVTETKPRKRAAAPADKAGTATTARAPAKPPRRAASTKAAPATAEKQPRKRTAAAKSGGKTAPAKAGVKSRKRAAAPAKSAGKAAAAKPSTSPGKRP